MKSLNGNILKKSPVKSPKLDPEKKEDAAFGLNIALSFIGLDVVHLKEVFENAAKVGEGNQPGAKRSKSITLNPRDQLDPRKKLRPR